jgi:hypothetical protein
VFDFSPPLIEGVLAAVVVVPVAVAPVVAADYEALDLADDDRA